MTDKRKIFAFVRRFFLLLVGLALGICLYYANAEGMLGNRLPMPFGYGIANVLSGSMEPAFSTGSLVVVKETKDVQKGDIVVYQSEGTLIIHRVMEIKEDTVVTKGDANNTPDPKIKKDQICGKAVIWIPYLGTALSMVRSPLGILVLLILAFFLIEGSFYRQKEKDDVQLEAIREEIRRLKKETDQNTEKALVKSPEEKTERKDTKQKR